MGEEIVILITAGSAKEAGAIARVLVDEHLAACVNVLPGLRSVFFWEGKTQEADETLMVCKSRREMLDKVIERVKVLHSYKVPEIIALPVVAGLPEYLRWVRESTGG